MQLIDNKEALLYKIQQGVLDKVVKEFDEKKLGKDINNNDLVIDQLIIFILNEKVDKEEDKEKLLTYMVNKYKVNQRIGFKINNVN